MPLGASTASDPHAVRTKGKPAPKRVKALYDFEPNEEGELPFKEGDIIRVIDSVYQDWWKGELRGQIGIFPVNYIVR
jgi:signal transducing adaptor molecule